MSKIENKQQYENTLRWVVKFQQELLLLKTQEPPPNVDPKIWKAVADAHKAMMDDLNAQIDEYEAKQPKE